MATNVEWKTAGGKKLLVNCGGCEALLLEVDPGAPGTRTMRCFGACVLGSDRFPGVAYLVCGACGAVTTIPRSMVPSARVPSRLHASLPRGQAARIVLGPAEARRPPVLHAFDTRRPA